MMLSYPNQIKSFAACNADDVPQVLVDAHHDAVVLSGGRGHVGLPQGRNGAGQDAAERAAVQGADARRRQLLRPDAGE